MFPNDWKLEPLPDLVFFQEGPGITSDKFRESGTPFLNIRCFENDRINREACQCVSPSLAFGVYKHFLLNEGEWVFSSSGTIGKIAAIRKQDLPLMLNTSTIRFRSRDETIITNEYIKVFLQSGHFSHQHSHQTQGSAQVNLGPTHLQLMFVPLPTHPEQRKIAKILTTIDRLIEQTEALTAVDVNTGSYVGKRNLEETILKTNLEAVKEIAYQLRFRNIGGLIVIDFIDMEKRSNRERVFMTLKEVLSKDKAKTNILPMSDLGLIEMTRKRTRASLNRLLTEPCFYCEGRGALKSARTICYEIFRDLEREGAAPEKERQVYVLVNPEIENFLREEEQESIIELEKRISKRIIVIAKKNFHLEQYEISV